MLHVITKLGLFNLFCKFVFYLICNIVIGNIVKTVMYFEDVSF